MGARHRRARGARPADRVRGGRRLARRHRGRLRRRCVRGADRQPDRRRRGARRDRDRDQGRHLAPHRHPRHRRLARQPPDRPRRLARAAGCRPRRPVAGAHLGGRRAAGGDPVGARHRRGDRSGVVRRGVQLRGLADGPGGDLAAGGPRTGAARVDADGVLPAQPDDRGRGAACRARPRPRGARLVAARPRRAHGQVPHRHPGRLPGRHLTLLRVRGRLPRPALAAGGRSRGPRRRRARLDPARGRAGLGPGPAGRHGPHPGRADGPAAARCPRGRGAHAARRDHGRPGRRLGVGGRFGSAGASEGGE